MLFADAQDIDRATDAFVKVLQVVSTVILGWAVFFRKSKTEDVATADAREIRISDVLQKLLLEANERLAAEAARFARKEANFEKRMAELHEENRELAEKLMTLTHNYELQQREIADLKSQLARKGSP